MSLFDLDQTLITKNSSYLFGAFLFRKKALSAASMIYCVACYASHKMGLLSLVRLHQAIFRRIFLNRSYAIYEKYARLFIEEYCTDIDYFPAVECLNKAIQAGHYTAIISSSPNFIVKEFARKYNVNNWFGTSYDINAQGRMTGISILDPMAKKDCLLNLSSTLHISPRAVDAYSDSHLDLPFLLAAGKGIGVNPDKQLKKICLIKNWEII